VVLCAGTAAYSDTLNDIRRNGVLRVGVLQDTPPYSFRERDGRRLGLEPDLAADIAATIGVTLQLVPVEIVDRIDALVANQVDIVIAGLAYNAQIARAVELVLPPYYASGTNVLTRKSERLTSWAGLAGVPVCSIQGAGQNLRLTGDYGVELITHKSVDEAHDALTSGNCRAFAFADSAIVTLLRSDTRWRQYEMPLQPIDEQPWAMATRIDDPLFSALLTGIAFRWHHNGTLLSLQDKWKIARTPFVESLNEIYR
jgi:polar amino acid transport system substrate-binding protein